MANRYFHNSRSIMRELILIPGQFTVDGSGVPLVVTNTPGVTVTRTGVGLYLLTLADSYNVLLGGFVAGSEALSVISSYVINQANSTLAFTHLVEAGGTLAAAEATSSTFTYFIVCQNTGVR